MDAVAFVEQEVREICAVLPSDTGDQCNSLGHDRLCLRWVVGSAQIVDVLDPDLLSSTKQLLICIAGADPTVGFKMEVDASSETTRMWISRLHQLQARPPHAALASPARSITMHL